MLRHRPAGHNNSNGDIMEIHDRKRWLTPSDLEQEYGFSKSTQAKMRMSSNASTIPFSKIGAKFIRYDRILIDKWLEDHQINGEVA